MPRVELEEVTLPASVQTVAKSAELGFFNTVAAGCFSCPRVEATPIT